MKLIITGNHTFEDYSLLKDRVEDFLVKHHKDPIEAILTRSRKGAESLGERFAKELDIPIQYFVPDETDFGTEAEVINDAQLVDAADAIIIFWDGVSTSKSHTRDMAEKRNLIIEVVRY
jgi:hypothetical protein